MQHAVAALGHQRLSVEIHASYVSLGIGMVLGVLLGLIPFPIPGVGKVTLGITGGPLDLAFNSYSSASGLADHAADRGLRRGEI
jgi:uncharacterized transporter YbjL